MYSLNGQFFTNDKLNISLDNRGVMYGDGVFETIRVQGSEFIFLEQHLARLSKACEVLSLDLDIKKISEHLFNYLSTSELKTCLVKLYVTRKPGGLFEPVDNNVDVLITNRKSKTLLENKKNVKIFTAFAKNFSVLSPYKTLNSLPYVLAGLYKKQTKSDEIILINSEGNIVECLYSNVIWIKNNVCYTPSLSTGCVDGVMLANIRLYLQKQGIEIQTGEYQVNDLLVADCVITSNVNAIQYLEQIENKKYNTCNKLVEDLKRTFF